MYVKHAISKKNIYEHKNLKIYKTFMYKCKFICVFFVVYFFNMQIVYFQKPLCFFCNYFLFLF